MALDVVRAESVSRAAAILAAEPGARFLAGGTLVVRAHTAGDPRIEKLILADGLGLEDIAVEGGRITLGAAVTMAGVARHPALKFLRPVAESIGGPAVRAMATVGGNLFAPYPYGDFAVALLALDAEVAVERPGGVRTMPLETFLPRRDASGVGIVTRVSFAMPAAGAFRFAKAVRKRPHGASVLSIAAVLPIAASVIAGARVAYGAMAPAAIRARVVERVLEGKRLDAETIATAAAVAAEGCAPLSDPHASAWYRSQVLPVHLGRLLKA